MKLAWIHFEDKALYKFQSFLRIKERGRLLVWNEFVVVLIAIFGEQLFKDQLAKLKKLKYVGSLQSYEEQFDLRLSTTNLNEAEAISHFLGGLQEEIEISVRVLDDRVMGCVNLCKYISIQVCN